ncbi:MAG: tyrosine/phenylalanine carboxypeptidase domain-containing protein, partial [Planctomycetota bacterium]
VLSEYLVGGLSRPRLRVLAARVVAAHLASDGATFVETFRVLHHDYRFPVKVAYTIAMRIFRGGGMVKDAIYLRGLQKVLEYLRSDGELEPLFVGKISASDIPLILELQRREVLSPPPLQPHYLGAFGAEQRLEKMRNGATVLDLIRHSPGGAAATTKVIPSR